MLGILNREQSKAHPLFGVEMGFRNLTLIIEPAFTDNPSDIKWHKSDKVPKWFTKMHCCLLLDFWGNNF